jgi:RHS repeat-associated protein
MGYRTNLSTSPSALAAADAASGRSWCYAYEGNGNVSAVVDLADGMKVVRYEYDAFGRTIATWGDEALAEVNEYRFSTKALEGTGLYYYGYRWYEAENGRWLGRDPIGERGGVNLYGFVRNRPVSIVDRLGLTCIKEITVRFDSSESAPQLFSPDEYGNPDPNRPVPTSGRVFHGQMCAYGLDDNVIECWSIKSGGFRSGDSKVEQDDDTAVPAGNYKVQTNRTGDLQGYLVVGTPQRYGIMIHDATWGTQGCLGVLSEYESLHGHMTDTREKIKRENVPIRIRYTMVDGTARPTGNRGFGNSDPDYPDDLPLPLDTEGPPGSGSNFPFN